MNYFGCHIFLKYVEFLAGEFNLFSVLSRMMNLFSKQQAYGANEDVLEVF